ncbi:MAG: DNA cytosine methyltransferase [Herpetosiphonaceae bacterium]|nr:DNA cytosine methyltransferase [Herpetosiphonaceae bacterium]
MRSIELFTGAGGLALGTHRGGFHHLAVVERDRDSCDTLRLNVKRKDSTGVDWPIIESDVANVDYAVYPESIDLLAAGAPCQPFSLGGKHAGNVDERNMFPEVFRAVRELRPRAFLLENVKGLMRESFGPYFDYIIEQLCFPHIQVRIGEGWEAHKARIAEQLAFYLVTNPLRHSDLPDRSYSVHHHIINVADYGVPQQRHRVFIVGFRLDLAAYWAFPVSTHSEDALLYSQYVDGSYWEEHGLEPRVVPERLVVRVKKLAQKPKPAEKRWRTVRDALRDLPEPINYERHPEFDNHVGIPDARVYKGHTGSPWDWPAKAIKAGDHGNPGGENMLRRDNGSVRYFTVRELARLQTFPDEWYFANSWTETRRQLGNAVPVKIAEILSRQVYDELKRLTFTMHPERVELMASLG